MARISSTDSGDSIEHVGARARIGFAPAQRFVEPQRRACVGPGDDEEIRARARLYCHADLLHHVFQRDHAPAGRVAALLREFLVLELDRGGARFLVTAHGVAHVEQPAVARVAVADERRAGHRRHAPHAIDHVRVGGETRVGQTEVGSHRAEARHVERIEAERAGEPHRNHVVHPGCHDELARREQLTETRGRHGPV
jgi:hypothetical protein